MGLEWKPPVTCKQEPARKHAWKRGGSPHAFTQTSRSPTHVPTSLRSTHSMAPHLPHPQDIGRALAAGGSLADHLSRWASPAVTIPHAGFSAQAAAGVMLAYRVKALPVVDDAGRALG